MKVYCILLLLGFVTFANCELDYHRCDHAAANIVLTKAAVKEVDTNRKGVDRGNQNIYIGDFLKNDIVYAHVARATYRNMLNLRTNEYCTTVSFSENCGPIYYVRKILEKPKPVEGDRYDENLKGKVIMQTIFFGYHYPTEKLYGYSMISVLVNNDDLIFQAVKKSIKVYRPGWEGHPVILVADNIRKIIIAVEYTLFGSIDNGRATVAGTCNEDYAWGAYSSDVVEKNLEGELAEKLEKVIKSFDTDTHKIYVRTNNFKFSNVRPVSTASFVEKEEETFVREMIQTESRLDIYRDDIRKLLEEQAKAQEEKEDVKGWADAQQKVIDYHLSK